MLIIFDYLLNLYTIFFGLIFITDFSFIFRKGISNISGFSVIFIILLTLRWFIDKNTLWRLLLFRIKNKISSYGDRRILGILVLVLSLVLFALSLIRHISLSSMSWDMGIFSQALWNTLRGDILFSSIRGNMNLLGDHFEPILFFLLPFYALLPNVATLLVIQALFLSASIIPLYFIAKDKLQSRFLVFSILFSFIISKAVRGINLSDFHPESLMVFFSLAAFYFLIKNRNLLLWVFVILLLMCKETASFIVLGLGFYAFSVLKKRKLGASLVLLAVAGWLVETRIIIPRFNAFGKYLFFERMPFGLTYQENLIFIVRHPLEFLHLVFIPRKIIYFIKLIGPLGFSPLFAFREYILILLSSVNVLFATENKAEMYLLSSHYVGHLLPFIYIAGIYGTANLIKFLTKRVIFVDQKGRFSIAIGMCLVILSLLFFGKTDGYKFSKFMEGIKRNCSFKKFSYLSVVPKGVSVSATANLVPHLCHRKYIYDWRPEGGMPETEYYVIDLDFTGYLNEDAKKQIPAFLKMAQLRYRTVFSNAEKTFFVFHNPGADPEKIEDYRGNLGLKF